jgi:large repetitive protein
LPAGVSLNASTGTITGTPTASCSCSFSITVTDSADNTYVSPQLALTIAAGVGITTTLLPNGVVSTAYSTQLAASGGTPPYSSWTVQSGSLPSGLNLNSTTGAIGGTPTAAGPCSFKVTVKDSAGNTSPAQSLSITIVSTLTITTTSLPGGLIGTLYSQTLGATGGTQPYTWSQASGSLPPGFSSISSGGLISGTPQQPVGTYNFSVKVTDAGGQTAVQALSITTTNPLTITAASNCVYASLTDTITASQSVTWSLSQGSPGSISTTGPSTSTVYTAPSSVTGTQYATITGTAGGNSGSVTLILVTPNPSLVPQSGSNFNVGQPVTFTMSVGDSAGWSTSNDYLILDLTPGLDAPYWADGCMVQYEAYIQKVWLVQDDGVDFRGDDWLLERSLKQPVFGQPGRGRLQPKRRHSDG